MAIKIYISGISGNKEVKKRQQRVLMILDSKNIKYEVVDIAEPGNEEAKEFMQNNAKSMGATVGDANPRSPLPPQIFNDEDYCGDYDQFDLANEIDEIEKFLKLAPDDSTTLVTSSAEIKLGNGEINSESAQNDNEAEAKQEAPSEKAAENEKDEKVEHAADSADKLENGSAEPEAEVKAEAEAETKTEAEGKESSAEAENETKADEVKEELAETNSNEKDEAEADSEPEGEAESEPEAETKAEAKSQAETKAATEPEAEADATPTDTTA